jgi:hypothetical protein
MLRGLAAAGGSLALLGYSEPTAGRRRRCRPRCGPGMRCVRRQCVVGQGTCPTGAHACVDTAACAPPGQEVPENCQCYVSTEGQTRCASGFIDTGPPSDCGQCASSDECKKLYPDVPGIFCVKVANTGCCDTKRGYCAAPCPTPPPCTQPEDCPNPDASDPRVVDACLVRTCQNGRCGKAYVEEGTPLPNESQLAGDCRVAVCDSQGRLRLDPDDNDAPPATECSTGECDGAGHVVHEPLGEPCNNGTWVCNGAGDCVDPAA